MRGEAVQPADGRERPRGRRRSERGPAVRRGAQRDDETGDVLLADHGEVVDAHGVQVRHVALEVDGVGAQRVGGAAPLHREVVQEGLDDGVRARHGRSAQRRDDLAFEQLDTRAVVCGLREVQDRVLTAEVAQPLQLLDDLLGRATGGVR